MTPGWRDWMDTEPWRVAMVCGDIVACTHRGHIKAAHAALGAADRAIERHPLLTIVGAGLVFLHIVNAFDAAGVQHLDVIHRLALLIARKAES